MLFKYSKHYGYEVSSIGDIRFSALFARLEDGRTIEQHYQCDVKQYDPLGLDWRVGKGKPPLDKSITPDILYQRYLNLWQQWANNNPDLINELFELACKYDYTLRDSFATSRVNQARALVDILNQKFR